MCTNQPIKIKKSVVIYYIIQIVFVITVFFVVKSDNNIYPTQNEIISIEKNMGSIKINRLKDLIIIQNRIVDVVKHKTPALRSYPLDITDAMDTGEGLCYDRSLILQKIFLFNGIKIRPVYIFFAVNSNRTTWLSLLMGQTDSHAAFEFYWNGKWYYCQTTSKMHYLNTIDEYLNSELSIVPRHSKYIRHVNNLNGSFIGHRLIPDFY